MNTPPDCYGDMFPDFTRMQHNRLAEGVAFSALVECHGLVPQSRKLELKPDGCAKCAACPSYRTCYDFCLAKLLMNTLLANGWHRS